MYFFLKFSNNFTGVYLLYCAFKKTPLQLVGMATLFSRGRWSFFLGGGRKQLLQENTPAAIIHVPHVLKGAECMNRGWQPWIEGATPGRP